MTNPYHAESKRGLGANSMKPPPTGVRRKGKVDAPIKPAFGKIGLPGPRGPDRSAGVKRVKQHPHSEGL